MAKPSTFGNMVLSLSIICLVCSALLGVVYSITKDPIAAVEARKVNDAIAAVLPQFDSTEYSEDGESQIYIAKSGDGIVGYAIKVKTSGFGGSLQMMVGFQPDGTIYNTSVISHSETPGLGAKISDEGSAPRAGVRGKNAATANLTVSKDGGDIDAITASTITSRAFLKGVNAAYDVFKKIAPAPVEEQGEVTSNTEENE
ncbi:MAG: RnfABCDGE type electron transport complex subunit G [Bacteroidales bacterium]|nr:RnfABCDGE type electron transport complex subunit G [Candidatus Cacconaster caballi]